MIKVGRQLAAGWILGMVLIAGVAHAQERYQLTEDQWVQQKTFVPGTPEAKLQLIRKLIAQEKGKEAQKAIKKWIDTHQGHALMPQAYLISGDAKVARKHYYKALFDYELLIRMFPASEDFHTGLEREYEIALLFSNGVRRRWLGARTLSAAGEAEEVFIRIQERAPGSQIGEKASLALADFYFRRGEMASAAEAYQLFLENYSTSNHRERVMLRRIEADLASFQGPVFDPTGLLNATLHIKQFAQEFPASAERMGSDALLIRVTDSLALKDFYTAKWYESQKNGDVSAAYMYQRVMQDYPQTSAAKLAQDRLAKLDPQVQGGPLQ